jgi:hypothetical protein
VPPNVPQKSQKAPQKSETSTKSMQKLALLGAFWCFCHREAPQPNQISLLFFTPKTCKNGAFPPSDIIHTKSST